MQGRRRSRPHYNSCINERSLWQSRLCMSGIVLAAFGFPANRRALHGLVSVAMVHCAASYQLSRCAMSAEQMKAMLHAFGNMIAQQQPQQQKQQMFQQMLQPAAGEGVQRGILATEHFRWIEEFSRSGWQH